MKFNFFRWDKESKFYNNGLCKTIVCIVLYKIIAKVICHYIKIENKKKRSCGPFPYFYTIATLIKRPRKNKAFTEKKSILKDKNRTPFSRKIGSYIILLVCFFGEILTEVLYFSSTHFNLIFRKSPWTDVGNWEVGRSCFWWIMNREFKINRWSKNVWVD